MVLSDFGILFSLLEKASLVILIFFLIFQIKFFKQMLAKKLNVADQLILAVIFGILAIYGTYSGVQTSGAIANIRNLSPVMAGFIGGPWVGLGAGLIGGIHRYFIGGFTAIPCALGTIISGLAAGIMYMLLKDKIGIWKPTLYAFVMECLDMTLILLLAHPFDKALSLVRVIAMPMIVGDTIGIAVFAFILSRIRHSLSFS